jgi:hypothetical protein
MVAHSPLLHWTILFPVGFFNYQDNWNSHNHHYHYPIGKNREVDYIELVIRQSIKRGNLFNPILLSICNDFAADESAEI